MSPSSIYSSLGEQSMTSSHLISLRNMNYVNLMNGSMVMGSFIGFSLVVWYLILKLFEII